MFSHGHDDNGKSFFGHRPDLKDIGLVHIYIKVESNKKQPTKNYNENESTIDFSIVIIILVLFQLKGLGRCW
jgi:hypothetical protein